MRNNTINVFRYFWKYLKFDSDNQKHNAIWNVFIRSKDLIHTDHRSADGLTTVSHLKLNNTFTHMWFVDQRMIGETYVMYVVI